MFHALGVLEVHVTWWLIQGAAPLLLTSFIFEGANRLVQVLFKFVPLRTGVDELTTGGFTQMLGFGAALGDDAGDRQENPDDRLGPGRDLAADPQGAQATLKF